MKSEEWTKEELDFLYENPNMKLKDISQKIPRSVNAVRGKRSQLGIKNTSWIPQIGDKFGHLTILAYYYKEHNKQKHMWIHCQCDCGQTYDAPFYDIKRGQNISCGCQCKSSDKFDLGVKIGDKINRLTIMGLCIKDCGTQLKTFAKCRCECGNITDVRLTSIIQNKIKSCGCLRNEEASKRISKMNYKHGMGDLTDRLYRIWCGMKSRCNHKSHESWKDYGGRGIRVCDEWKKDFVSFYNWAINHGYTDDLSIDRINVNGNYNPSNCRWADAKTQARNKRNNRLDTVKITAFGETQALGNWLEDERCAVSSGTTICYRIGAGWSPEEAITKPSERSKNK